VPVTGDIFGTGVSGLLAFQRALGTTGHNIANVNTEGYNRQRVELEARPPQFAGGNFIGTGVQVAEVARLYDGFLTAQVRAYSSSHSQLEEFHRLAGQVDNLLADPDAGLATGLQRFFNAAHAVANDPSSTTARQVMLSEAQSLVDRFRYLDDRLEALRQGVNTQIRNSLVEINGYAQALADINRRVVIAQGAAGGEQPNDLLDQRDAILAELSKRVAVSTLAQDDGALNVFIGNGQTLVIGTNAFALSATANLYDPTRLEIYYGTAHVSDQLTGGSLGAALDFRASMLDTIQNELGRLASGMALTFNAQHAEGLDLNGDLGGDFFTPAAARVLVGANNTGAGNVAVSLVDGAALTASDYLARYNGVNWTVTRLSDNYSQTGAGPFSLDGLTITPGGAADSGDSFLIQPTRNGAAELARGFSDPRLIAAADPIRTAAALANTGSATISTGEVLDATDSDFFDTVTLEFVSATQYQVNGAGPLMAYTSGANIDLNGWRVVVSGTPADGDVFTIAKNNGGVSDNRNALRLAELRQAGTLAGGTASYEASYGQIVTTVGASVRSAEINRNAQQSLLTQVTAARDSVSGVNLDEEAANLLRFQQAYQAAAQVIATADTVFQTLLDAVRR
jgi:flagellar hook-associated protein 1 FlgK